MARTEKRSGRPDRTMTEHAPRPRTATRAPGRPAESRPDWNDQTRELWFHGRLVKRYRHEAAAQRAILRSLQELGWPRRMDDPLPREPGIDPKKRLRQTVQNLNRGQRPLRIRFSTDGTGTGLFWDVVADEPRARKPGKSMGRRGEAPGAKGR